MIENFDPSKFGPDYLAMAAAILRIAADLREIALKSGDQERLAQAERLEQIAANIRAGLQR